MHHLPDIFLLCLAGILAGFVNTLAGGGSLISVPALIWFGVPAAVANGSSRVGVAAQSASGALGFAKAKKFTRAEVLQIVPPTLLGAALGAYAASALPNAVIEPLLLVTLLLVAVSMLWKPERMIAPPESEPQTPREKPWVLLWLFLGGIYGGIVQAGAGPVFLAILGGVLRYPLTRANALKTMIVFSYSMVALAIFIWKDMVAWQPAIWLMLGSIIGAQLGVWVSLRYPQETLRRLVIVLCLASCLLVLVRYALG